MNKLISLFYKRTLWLAIWLSLGVACVDNDRGDTSSASQFDGIGMMMNITDNVILKGYREFVAALEVIDGVAGSLNAYCEVIGTDAEAAALSQVQDDWKRAINLWQQAEVWNVGPAAENSASLRNLIYSFGENSRLSTCGADQAVVLAQQDMFDIRSRAVNHRGLLVLDYILFNEALSHTCPSQVTETQDWNTRSEMQRKQWRCDYAGQVVNDITMNTNTLINAWQPGGGNFRSEFLDPQRYEESLNALSDALFYLDTETKDLKLGIPLSLNDACSQFNCANDVELIYSRHSLQSIRNNLIGFENIFSGSNGLGFDDLIASKGFTEVADDMSSDVDAAITALDLIIDLGGNNDLYSLAGMIDDVEDESSCMNAIANPDRPGEFPICNVYGLIKRISDHLKIDFVMIVNLDLPDRAQSDND